MAVHSLDCCLPETEGDVRPWQYTVWTAVCLRLRVMLDHMAVHSLDGCLPETEGDVRPLQYSLDCCLPETEGDVRSWQYTVWTVVCLRLSVMLDHGSTQSGLLSA